MSRSLITCELVGMDCDRFVLVPEKFRTLLDGFGHGNILDLKCGAVYMYGYLCCESVMFSVSDYICIYVCGAVLCCQLDYCNFYFFSEK
jgi:hypothetical protein